jgi:hypothetical protein
MNEVHVFTTSVQSIQEVKRLAKDLNGVAGKGNWNFALDDCDRILRVSSVHVSAQDAIRLLREKGFECAELDS